MSPGLPLLRDRKSAGDEAFWPCEKEGPKR